MALYIVGAVLLILIILFHSPFRFRVLCDDNKLSVTMKYLFFSKKLYPSDKEKKPSKERDKKSAEDKKDTEDSGKKKKRIFPENKDEQIPFIINILKSSGKFLKAFTKRITIKGITADIDISREDACDCAVSFGKANIVVYNLLSFCSVFFRVRKKHININCVYNKPESVYNYSFTVKFTPSAGILSIIAFIFTFFVNNIKTKRNLSKQRSEKPLTAAE